MVITKTGKRRLMTLIRFMEGAPRSVTKHFNMGVWFMHMDSKHSHGIHDGAVVDRKALNECGTKACALGWAATIPSFRKAGLQLIATEGIGTVRFGDARESIGAASAFFEIGRWAAHDLFMGVDAKTPKAWAKAAREMIDA